jgi:stage V sporulation protein S
MLMKASAVTPPTKLAGAIAHYVRESGGEDLALQAIGAEAVNQAMKAVAYANIFLREDGLALLLLPSRMSVPGYSNDGFIQVMRFTVVVEPVTFGADGRPVPLHCQRV